MCELCLPTISRRRALGLMAGATAGALLGRPDPAASASAEPTGYGIAVEPRATWAGDDRPPLESMADEDVRFLLVHHTAGPSEGDPIGLMRQVYDFHTGPARGWPDVAYNFFVEPGGRVFEGRAGSLQRAVEGSATGGNQGFAQLVCLLGDFTSRIPTDAQLRSLNGTLAWLADRYGLDTSAGSTVSFTSRGSNKWAAGAEVTADIVSGHREMSATACPGDTFFPYLKERVQAEVQAVRAVPGPVVNPTPEESSTSSTVAPETTVTSAPASTTSVTSTIEATGPSSTNPSTVAAEAAAEPTVPSAEEPATSAADSAGPGGGQSSSNSTAFGVGAGAAAVAGAAVVYAGVRRRDWKASGVAVIDTPVGDLPPPSPGSNPSE